MSQVTDWEPEMINEIDWEQGKESSLSLLQREYNNYKKSSEQNFESLKSDVIVVLKALELCAIASQRDGDIALNHHVRDMRLAHLQSIIKNSLEDFGDRNLTSYDNDF